MHIEIERSKTEAIKNFVLTWHANRGERKKDKAAWYVQESDLLGTALTRPKPTLSGVTKGTFNHQVYSSVPRLTTVCLQLITAFSFYVFNCSSYES